MFTYTSVTPTVAHRETIDYNMSLLILLHIFLRDYGRSYLIVGGASHDKKELHLTNFNLSIARRKCVKYFIF